MKFHTLFPSISKTRTFFLSLWAILLSDILNLDVGNESTGLNVNLLPGIPFGGVFLSYCFNELIDLKKRFCHFLI